MTQLVQGFGLHRQDDLVWLHEGAGARCLTPGLAGLESPFTVTRLPRQLCPHVLPEPAEGAIPDDPLAYIMAPTPDDSLYWVPSSHGPTIFAMAQHMTDHPFDPAVFSWSGQRQPKHTLPIKLLLTNCVPMVLSGYSARDFQDILALSRLPRQRSLVLVGHPQIPGSIDLSQNKLNEYNPEELRTLSAAYLHRWLMKVTLS